jgi:hypothetical protein
LAHWLSGPHPSTSLARASKVLCKAELPGSTVGYFHVTHYLKPGHIFPSQAGTSCVAGASTARTWDGQPSPSGIHGHRGKRTGGVDAGHFPAVPAPKTFPKDPPGIRPPDHSTLKATGNTRPSPAKQESKVDPTHTSAESRAVPTRCSLGSYLGIAHHLPARSPTNRHPRSACTLCKCSPLHVVGKAHFYQHVDSNVPGG